MDSISGDLINFLIFARWLKSRFTHCKIDKIWIFLRFGQRPLGGPLTATTNGKVVLDALIWCLAVSGVDLVWFLNSFFWSLLILMLIYGRFLDFGTGTLSWKFRSGRIRTRAAWDREFCSQKQKWAHFTSLSHGFDFGRSYKFFDFSQVIEKSISAL